MLKQHNTRNRLNVIKPFHNRHSMMKVIVNLQLTCLLLHSLTYFSLVCSLIASRKIREHFTDHSLLACGYDGGFNFGFNNTHRHYTHRIYATLLRHYIKRTQLRASHRNILILILNRLFSSHPRTFRLTPTNKQTKLYMNIGIEAYRAMAQQVHATPLRSFIQA